MAPCAEHLVYGLFERHIGILLPKSSQAKNLPDTEKSGDFWLSSIKLYYSKKIRNFELNNNKNDLHHGKKHKKLHIRHLNIFFYFSNGFRAIRCQTPIFKLEPSFYCTILAQSSLLKQKYSKTIRRLKKLFTCLICSFLCSFSWCKSFLLLLNSKFRHFLLQYNLIEDNHKSPSFSVSGKFFAWEIFLVAMYLYVFQINHKPSVPQMGATKMHF